MKRAIMAMVFSAALLLTLSSVLASDTTDEAPISVINADVAPSVGPVATNPPTDDQWDLLFWCNATDSCGDTHMLGVEFVGDYFWTTGGNSGSDPNKIYKIYRDGTLEATYNQPSAATSWGFRDLAWDGTYLYASPDNGIVYAFDLDGSMVPTSNINGPETPNRALAYDPVSDHFWTKSFSNPIYEFDRNGTIHYQGTITEASGAYGMAWDNADPAGPWLWIFCQIGPTVPDQRTTIVQYDPVAHVATGVTYLLPMVAASVGQVAGGLAFTNEYDPDYYTLIGMTQGDPDDLIFVLEMYEAGAPGNLEGEVSELASSDPIEGAMVVLGDDTTYTNALGDYYFSNVPAGTHDVTASAFGYNPQTASVEITSGQTTVQDFALTQPIISVDVSIIELELYPGQLHDETFNISNLGDGDLEFNIEIDFDPTTPPPTILVVDDDGGPNNGGTYQDVQDAFWDALDDAGYDYDTMSVDWSNPSTPANGPNLTTMMNYDIVIWFTGETWGYYGDDTLTEIDEDNLEDYLDAGGNLFLSGQDYLWESYPTAGAFSAGQFPYDYLGVTSTTQDLWTPPLSATGGAGSIAEGMTFSCTVPYPSATLWCDQINNMGTTVLLADNQGPAACQYEGATFKSVFTTLSFEGLVDGAAPSTKAQFMENMISWMNSRGADIVEAPPRPAITPTERANPAARSTGVEHPTNTTLAGPVTRTAPGYFETDQPWLECNPSTGTVQPAGSQTITASFDIPDTATVGDVYDAQIIIHNNTISGDQTIDVIVDIVSSVDITGSELPLDYALYQNYPNPFNPSTDIRFDLREHTHVTLAVYNILGQKVLTLVDKPLDAGTHLVSFNAASFASGVYFYTINAGSFTDMKKMVLMK